MALEYALLITAVSSARLLIGSVATQRFEISHKADEKLSVFGSVPAQRFEISHKVDEKLSAQGGVK